METLILSLGGFCGAIARYLVSLAWNKNRKPSFSLSIVVINTLGSLCLGLLNPFAFYLGPQLRLFILAGFLGAFTTFSTYSMESVELLRSKDFKGFFLYMALSIGGSILMYYAGYTISTLLKENIL
ncbi:CrcB protein [Peribacillus deserti]|uniref:Fluoride-specific ion channel FluC n=1 Tax=Peribacillus deserti TaxID=673318 RepID=A0ABS2QN81_9BACI|nr:fluoride efflux transporter CrcB [Peribacillus deserti]MBM7694618.1 CrcB protein [Peribacillus deserti]